MNRNLTPTQETLNRMQISGLLMEKASSANENGSVRTGDEITYTVTLNNKYGVKAYNLQLTDVLPAGTEYVSSTAAGVTVNGNKLSWKGNVALNTTVTVSYTVRVTATVSGTRLESNQTYVNGVKLGDITNTVVGYTAEQMTAVADVAKSYVTGAKSFDSTVAFINSVYKDALGVELFTQETVDEVMAQLIDVAGMTCKTTTELSKMIVPHLYGGRDIKNGTYKLMDERRTRLLSEHELNVGDIILATYDGGTSYTKWGVGNVAYIYVGDSTLIRVSSKVAACTSLTIGTDIFGNHATTTDTADNILVALSAYNQFVVLRPGLVAAAVTE